MTLGPGSDVDTLNVQPDDMKALKSQNILVSPNRKACIKGTQVLELGTKEDLLGIADSPQWGSGIPRRRF